MPLEAGRLANGKKEAVAAVVGHPGAWIVDQARRTVAEVGDRRHDAGGLLGVLRVPNLLATERPAIGEVLVRHPPPSVLTFDNLNDAPRSPESELLSTEEEIAEFVERQFLRVAQASGEQFQLAAVGIAAEDGTGMGLGKYAVGRFDMQAAIADREVENLPSGPSTSPWRSCPNKA